MNRRAFLHGLGAAAAAASCPPARASLLWNGCGEGQVSDAARRLVSEAANGIDGAKLWDVHCHVFGNGDSGSGAWSNPGLLQANRSEVIPVLLARREWHARLLNGSDYPLPGVVPLISLSKFADRGLIDPAVVAPLAELRSSNVLLFDFVLKRSLGNNGAGFARSVFETRPFFEASA